MVIVSVSVAVAVASDVVAVASDVAAVVDVTIGVVAVFGQDVLSSASFRRFSVFSILANACRIASILRSSLVIFLDDEVGFLSPWFSSDPSVSVANAVLLSQCVGEDSGLSGV